MDQKKIIIKGIRTRDKTDTDDEPDEMEEGDFFKLMVGWINEGELF